METLLRGDPWTPEAVGAAVPPPEAPGIPFRVRIGVTGHRTLKHPESVARSVEEVLLWIETVVFQPSPSTPVVYAAFSALANRDCPIVTSRRATDIK